MKKKVVYSETLRQAIHASGVLVIPLSHIIYSNFGKEFLSLFYLLMIALLVVFSKIIKKRRYFLDIFKIVDRKEDLEVMPAKGAINFFVGIFIVSIFFDVKTLYISIVVLSLGDSFSTVVGKKFGRHKIPYNSKKSVEGFLAFVVFAFVGSMFFCDFKVALILSIFGAFVESLPIKIDDNIAIPISVAILYNVLVQFF